jgi:hypothetical protein
MNEKVRSVLDKVLESFESGNVPEALSVVVLPQVDVPCSNWSLSNRLILFFSGTSDARGFRQWKEVNRWPKKGSKAIYIIMPKHTKVKEDDEERVRLTGFTPVPVFAYEQTEGKPVEHPELQPKQLPPLVEVARKWNISVNWQSFQGDALGYYSPGRKEIVLATHDERTFFHELGHAAHEKVRGKLKIKQDWKQEIVAELTSAVLAHLYGKKDDGGAYRYIRRYAEDAGKDVYKASLSVVSDVGRCLALILRTKEGCSEDNVGPMQFGESRQESLTDSGGMHPVVTVNAEN